MDKIIDFYKISSSIKESPINLINYLFTSGIILSLVTHFFYKSNVKWKHRQVIVSDDVAKLLRSFIKVTLAVPVIAFSFLWIVSNSKVNITALNFILILVIVLGILMIYFYIRTTRKRYGINMVNKKWKKFIRFVFRYFLVVVLIIISIIFNLLLIVILTLLITDYAYVKEEFTEFITATIALYIYGPYIIWAIIFSHEERLKKEIKSVGIFYSQNGKVVTDLNIRFEDFDIDKNYISFYSDTKKSKKIIQTKDLLRIEYYYND
ncbi:hypothetical protein [uncultured Tissierella sp.]|uniref:hypothetical protein n=1 Tax=uncultured Tissierella sp. TaxID=448160 RepID=UPI0028057D43|nr:hypothetical protein [uncultured Tissierella sp.]MDU5081211.1 hypothetical protein [Bacillota bacterium]